MLTSGLRLLIASAFALTVAACSGATSATPVPTAAPAVAVPNSVQSAQSLTPSGPVLGGGSKQIGDLPVWLSSPSGAPVRGQSTVQALVGDANGKPVTDARVSVDIDMTNMSHGKNVTTAAHVADGRYSANVSFMMPGPWRLIVVVERAGKQIGSARFDFNVNMR